MKDMMDAPRAFIVHVKIDEGRAGLLYATSPELPGLLVAERSRDALLEEIPLVIEALFREQGKTVRVIEAMRAPGSDTLAPAPWVAIPAHIAASAAAE